MFNMKTFFFYSRTDSKQEPINKIDASDSLDAVEKFAARKNMSVPAFLYVFGVLPLSF